MEKPLRTSLTPFLVALAILLVAALAVLRLPETLVAQLANNRFFTSSQSGWAYRLLVLAAVAQAAYGGFVLLRAENVHKARLKDSRIATLGASQVISLLSRNAAFLALLTLVYGLAAFAVTGQRGGFWLFPLIALLQGAWYYRQVAEVGRWLSLQAEPDEASDAGSPSDSSSRYCPPLARGLTPLDRPAGSLR